MLEKLDTHKQDQQCTQIDKEACSHYCGSCYCKLYVSSQMPPSRMTDICSYLHNLCDCLDLMDKETVEHVIRRLHIRFLISTDYFSRRCNPRSFGTLSSLAYPAMVTDSFLPPLMAMSTLQLLDRRNGRLTKPIAILASSRESRGFPEVVGCPKL